jgi:hypothetical protein
MPAAAKALEHCSGVFRALRLAENLAGVDHDRVGGEDGRRVVEEPRALCFLACEAAGGHLGTGTVTRIFNDVNGPHLEWDAEEG